MESRVIFMKAECTLGLPNRSLEQTRDSAGGERDDLDAGC
jgi:hypothetical protein